MEGSSGRPIFIENSTKVIGIHKAGNRFLDENYWCFITPIEHKIPIDVIIAPVIPRKKKKKEKRTYGLSYYDWK